MDSAPESSVLPGDGDAVRVDLYWLPLGAGGRCVRWNGRVYERLAAVRQHRQPRPLFHTALEVRDSETRYVIEMGPVWNVRESARGVVREGPVGAQALGSLAAFRYEIRCWRDGRIPDVAEAVQSPVVVSTDPRVAAAVLRLVHEVPVLTWGRDELGLGDMWNSNSLISWLLVSSGHDISALVPPVFGRVPGWDAGAALARQPNRRATR